MNMKIGDYVTCPRIGDGYYKIIDEDRMQYVIQSQNGEKREIFKVHCSRITSAKIIMQLRNDEKAARAEAASKIGRKKN